jgi:hypothetical protein
MKKGRSSWVWGRTVLQSVPVRDQRVGQQICVAGSRRRAGLKARLVGASWRVKWRTTTAVSEPTPPGACISLLQRIYIDEDQYSGQGNGVEFHAGTEYLAYGVELRNDTLTQRGDCLTLYEVVRPQTTPFAVDQPGLAQQPQMV